MEKIKLKAGSMRNQCPSCGELFTSVHSFDKHRHGRYGIPNLKKDGDYLPASRKCYTTDEMLAKGMVKVSGEAWASAAFENAGLILGHTQEVADAE